MALTTNLDHYWKCDEIGDGSTPVTRSDSVGSWSMTDANGADDIAGKIYAKAVDFAGGGEALYRTGENLGGHVDRTFEVWVKLASKATTQTLWSKGNYTDTSCRLLYDSGSDRFIWRVYAGTGETSGAGVSATTFGSPSTGVWYHIRTYYDATNNLIGIQVNNGTADTNSQTGGFLSETGEFNFGFQNNRGSDNFTGSFGPFAMWSKLLTTDEKAQTYNGGAGLTLAQMQRNPFGLAIWELGEAGALLSTDDELVCADAPGGSAASKQFTIAQFIAALCLSNVVVQTLTVASGTYTPTSGMKKVLGIAVGSGGAGAGGINTDSAGGGGGGGGTVFRLMTAAQIGASKAYAVGQANTGNPTTLDAAGALMNAGGGGNGTAGSQGGTISGAAAGGTGGTAANGDLNIPGTPGGAGRVYSGTAGCGGKGGSSVFGFGAAEPGSGAAGGNGTDYGGGGAGGHAATASDRAGGAGAAGVLYMIEFF